MSLGITGKFKKVSDNLSLRDSFGTLVLICLGGVGLMIFLQLILFFNYARLASKPPPTLVQLSNGESIAVKAIGSTERTSESIQKFVRDILTLTFTWTGTVPTQDANSEGNYQKDTGVPISIVGQKGKSGRITTAAWEASFAFELAFRQEFLKQLADLVPSSIFRGDVQVAFIPIYIQEPVLIEPGKWKIGVIANLIFLKNGNKIGEFLPFNKEVYVRAVVPPNGNLDFGDSKSKPLAIQIANMRQSGLEIYAMTDFNRQELK